MNNGSEMEVNEKTKPYVCLSVGVYLSIPNETIS